MTDEARQLTERAAREVMGWHKSPIRTWRTEDGDRVMHCLDFDPLHNIAHAWMLVEKMEKSGFAFQLYSPNPQGEKSDCWSAVFTRWEPTTVANKVAFSAPEAITRAAVGAVNNGGVSD